MALKRSWLKRGVWNRKAHENALKGVKMPLRRRSLRVHGVSDVSTIKKEIQAKLNQLVKLRDGGCILRDYAHIAGQCGSRPTKDGHLILQAEHLHTRANAASYADSRLVVCLCERHHIFWKPQYPDQYYALVKKIIGPVRTQLLERVQADRSPHHMVLGDWKVLALALQKEIDMLLTATHK